MKRVRILVFNAALGVLDYRVPEGMAIEFGAVVIAPLGPRQVLGIVWEPERLSTQEVPESKLRPLLEVLPVPPLPERLRRLIEWTADYYCASLSSVARMALGSMAALRGGGTTTEYRLTGHEPARLTPQRAAALDALQGEQGSIKELAELASVSEGVLRGMVGAGLLEPVVVDLDRPYPRALPEFAEPKLSDGQQAAADIFVEAVRTHKFAPFLLDGVTGSGKTETYFEAVAEALRLGRQVLVLLPEIALTENFLRRFEHRFGVPPLLWHSSLKSSERRRAWRSIVLGDAQVVVGARSALFLPYARLGLIVVDEAHEVSFKQDDGVRYNARDVAVMRSKFEGIPVVLASATPALESMQLAEAGVYRKVDLPARFGGAQLPDIQILDLRQEAPERGKWLAPRLVEEMKKRLAKGEQSLLFLNRRGYAPLTLCRHCGYRFQCPNCTAWLVEHRFSGRLACHHCGHEVPVPDACPECGTGDCLVACGPGVERIADEVAEILPEARVALVTSDTMNTAEAVGEFVAKAEGKAIDVIVGTQLVTKGYHFPDLTLVGVVDADLGLEGGDLRAAERTYQQVAQVAGRAGRGDKPGEVLIQTRHPEASVIAALAAGDRDAFYAAETDARRDAGAPPFGRWAAIIVSSEDQSEAQAAARAIGGTAPNHPDMLVLGPAPAPLSLLRGRHRFRLLINARRSAELQKMLREWLEPLQFPRSVRVNIDIDPYSFV
ncbi:primosomal protein N' [Novosphingobium aerophilum]|uniref:primosomal protein N' n=1 Tax=Novosphingobium TaxID=165696 RepID=UPI0006C84469|nr:MULTISPECIES: primosomal protein N' [unclassified Novosphingobium]KPH58748.1 primosome assembly protein PriA [Novosphingobium sp. ST904]MPS70715.1 primosomal protein N' [Novosphingobium sp.]TCM42252.1 replication restart DNA helicase PriA [Novosphingobium sp. ST904]WRT91519.1 primosomal protein N' [Novosphingobium sp. RL4]